MSDTDKVGVGKEVKSLDVSPRFEAYSGVEIIVDDEISYFAGSRVGRVLTIENPWGDQVQANAILESLQAKGFQYQPFTVTGAILNPAAEIGDGITVNGVYSGIYNMSRNYTSLMAADVEAPEDEEIDHEYPYEPKQDRIYKREIADARAKISVTQSEITAEVLRATEMEGLLRSEITQTAEEISANVVKKTGGSTSSFGWSLTDSAWSVSSNGSEVFRIDSNGATVKGIITATGGEIGGFTIGNMAIYNGMNNIDSVDNGIYIGTNGISIGGGNFKVTSSGTVSANNMKLTGTLKFVDANGVEKTMDANNLRAGAQSAYTNGSSWSGTTSAWNTATNSNNTSGPTYFSAASIQATSRVDSYAIKASNSLIASGSFQLGKADVYWVGPFTMGDGNTYSFLGKTGRYSG